MRLLVGVVLTACSFILSSTTLADSSESSRTKLLDESISDIKQLKIDSKASSREIEILRRDQINYRLEKDLLKEAYASNLQSINITITIVLGVIGVLGYLGIRSIKEVKTDYTIELENLKRIKAGFERELNALRDRQKKFEGQVGDLAKTNEEQDRRIKVMELIEKVGSLIGSKQWPWALKWISVGLGLDENNFILLQQKATCHGHLGEIAAAIDANKACLAIEPEDLGVVSNLLELFALTNQGIEFEKLYHKHKTAIDEMNDGNLIVYLKALASLTKGDPDSYSKVLSELVNKIPNEAKKQIGAWSFDEAMVVISKLPEGKQRTLMVNTVRLFNGEIDSGGFKALLEAE
ncbi:MAG: hypothetical protein Q8S20_12930 [Sulfuritalea sp.]|nr:hypothetical protein [Sulfuritalea sp.]